MADTCYPVFQEGQTLTRDDLNLLREFIDDRGRQVGRAIGFGVGCGLDGQITTTGGSAVVIDAGIAIDQPGEVLTLEAPVRLPLPPAATVTGYDFVDAAPGGFTVVVVAVDTITEAPDCDEEGCEGHAGTGCRSAELVMVPGRLAAAFDFASEDLVAKVTPLVAEPTPKQFEDLRTAILARLDDTLSNAAKAKLTSIAIATADLPAIKNAKAAFLNQVLFAALDLLLCRALMDIGCLREAAKPGVALGWAHQVSGAWQWDCSFRHAWEPPAGLSIALVGGACDDPCREHRERLESLILTFDLPPVPKPEDPPKGGGEVGDPYLPCIKAKKGSGRYVKSLEDCGILHVPPKEKLPHDWHINWTVPVKGGWPPRVELTAAWEIYESPEPDYFNEGIMVLVDAIGRSPEAAKTGILNAVKDAHVEVMSLDNATKLPGFTLSAAASPADTIVLIGDAHGKVVDIGSVPAQTGFRNASVAIPAASAAAASAQQIAEEVAGTVLVQGEAVGKLEQAMTGMVAFKTQTENKLKDTDKVFLGLDTQIANTAKQVYSQFQTQTATFLHNAVANGVKEVQGELTAQVNETVEIAMSDVKQQFKGVEERSREAYEGASRANTRVDQVLTGRAIGMTDREIGRQVTFNEDLVGVMRAVSDTIEASAPDAQKGAVEAQLKPGRETLDRMEAGVRAGSLVLQDERASLSGLLDTFVGALKASGAPAAQLKQLQASVKAVQEKLQ